MRKLVLIAYLGLCCAISILVLQGHVKLYLEKDGLLLPSGEIYGGDFIAFYTGARLRLTQPKELYNFEKQLQAQEGLIGEARQDFGFLPFVYPPLVALLLSPLGMLSFESAYFIWSLISVGLLIIAVESLLQLCEKNRRLALRPLFLLGALSFTPFSVTNLAGGQLASIGIVAVAFFLTFFHKERFTLAAIALGLSFYKPPLFLFLGTTLVLARPREFLSPLGSVVTAVLGLELLSSGPSALLSYFLAVTDYLLGDVELLSYQLPAKLGVGSLGIAQAVIAPGQALLLTAALFLIALFVLYRAGRYPYHLSPSYWVYSVVLLSLMLSIQVNRYDLSLVLPCLMFLLATTKGSTRLAGLPRPRTLLPICLSLCVSISMSLEAFLLPILALLAVCSISEERYKNSGSISHDEVLEGA